MKAVAWFAAYKAGIVAVLACENRTQIVCRIMVCLKNLCLSGKKGIFFSSVFPFCGSGGFGIRKEFFVLVFMSDIQKTLVFHAGLVILKHNIPILGI